VSRSNTVCVRFAWWPTNFLDVQTWDRCKGPPGASGRSQSRWCRGRQYVALVAGPDTRNYGALGKGLIDDGRALRRLS
jgi:hypothetical protein